MARWIIFLAVLCIVNVSVWGQTEVNYSFRCNLKGNTSSMVQLISKDNVVFQVNDLSDDGHVSGNIYLKPGLYRAIFLLNSSTFGQDSICRPFVINGKEKNIDIDMDAYYDSYGTRDSLVNVTAGVRRYYDAPRTVKLKYIDYQKSDSTGAYPGPIFSIKNCSRDTLVGEYLPGFFWGTVARIFDGHCSRFYPGYVCTSFGTGQLLYPDSTRESWVATLGKEIPPGKYRYRVRYTKVDEDPAEPYGEYLTRKFHWFTNNAAIYEVFCDFDRDSVMKK
ncbi:MAG: hypothetical protein VZR36_13330 [Prevotella sp.]|nr:hypothetical protein [Prevotella sp.]